MSRAVLPPRDEVHLEETWDLESIFNSLEAWEAAYQEVRERLPEIEAFEGRLSEGPQTLADCLDVWQEVMRQAEKVVVYAFLASSVDVSNQEAAARGRAGAEPDGTSSGGSQLSGAGADGDWV